MLNKRFFKTKDEAEVTFEFSHPEAEEVCLLGEFNDWKPVPMKLYKKQGVFKFKQRLPIDQQFHFRYLIKVLELKHRLQNPTRLNSVYHQYSGYQGNR